MSIEIKRKKLELLRVNMGLEELKFKMEEKYEEIERLKYNIAIQEETIKKVKQDLEQLDQNNKE